MNENINLTENNEAMQAIAEDVVLENATTCEIPGETTGPAKGSLLGAAATVGVTIIAYEGVKKLIKKAVNKGKSFFEKRKQAKLEANTPECAACQECEVEVVEEIQD